jgi:hypothetical protein
MDFDEEKYETKSSSDYWADVIKGVEVRNNEQEDSDENSKGEIFVCRACGFMYNLANPPKYLHPFNYYVVSDEPLKIKCPNCRKVVLYDTISKEEYEKYLEKKQKQKEEIKKKKEEKVKSRKIEQMKDDLKDLAKDLKDRLLSKEITPKRFVALFTYMSRNIVNRYGKNLDIDWLDFRKTIFELSDGILEVYKSEEKSEEILEEYTENIEDDELYRAEMEYYIEDNKYSIPDYELRQRIREYDRQEAKIRSDEYKKEIEEKYQKRKNELLQKAEERQRRQKLRDIM